MALATWSQTNPLPALPALTHLRVKPTNNVRLLANMAHLSQAEVIRRLDDGHLPYVAWLDDDPAAYGWAARQTADIGELDIAFHLPADQVYLWDFATLPDYRGLGIYPHLLQHILQHEAAARSWIIYAPENRASARGIHRAGFDPVGELSFIKWGHGAGLRATTDHTLAQAGAALLHVPLLRDSERIASCWGCTIRALQAERFIAPGCWSGVCGCV